MKLKNKKTGEIREIRNILVDGMFRVNSLAELNAEWEDVPEEPTGYWYIDFDGDILSCVEPFDEETDEKRKSIGNYFETEEEAEKAVEKLKAVKRLKDKGFRFISYDMPSDSVFNIQIKACCDKADYIDIMDELDLLFGGEE